MIKLNEEYFKGKVNWYRQLFTLFFAVEAGCIAWFVANVDKAYKTFVLLDVIAIIVTAVILSIIARKVLKYLKLMRD
jgi:tetrahydromethanopterin S-methyltransferase subunit C